MGNITKRIEYLYYIELESGMFGVLYRDKEKAIQTFLDNIKREKSITDSEYWQNHAKQYEEMIQNGKVKVKTIKQEITEIESEEILKR